MNTITDANNPQIQEGASLGNYEVERKVYLEEVAAFFYILRHCPTNAKHIHISNQDAENTFAVGFKTIPQDSTGVAHILEHTALCGSRNFPVRDPFFSMIKRSLNTFMNAFTASDWTLYPYCSQNEKDFYNLMDVYLDAAFFPLIDELSFKQEGHRLEIEAGENGNKEDLVYKGVVYNEMKGAMSSPSQVMVRSMLNALYPDTTYRFNSGGEPADIPSLTHEQLKAFHARHYHPSNAFFYTYGNLPLEKHLQFIEDRVLKNFEAIDPETEVPSQARWNAPKALRYTYPISKSEDLTKKCQVCLAWLTADIQDAVAVLSLMLLEGILLGNAASPLRKALMDSGLGAELSDGSGFDRDNRDTLFACGLKDTAESSADQIEALILDTLKTLSENGIEKELIESAIHQMELRRKEVTNVPYPYGLKLLLRFSGSWFHGGDPVSVIQFDENLTQIRKSLSQGPYFENLIRQYLLDNPHRVRMVLAPDTSIEEKENLRTREALDAIKSKLSADDLKKIKADQAALVQLQDAKEDLTCLPTLSVSDIPPDINRVKASTLSPDAPVSAYTLPTSGIMYFNSAIGIEGVDPEHLPMIPLFGYVFTKMGTRVHDYVELARQMSAYTGGIHMASHARSGYLKENDCRPFISLSGKSLNRNTHKLMELIEELICRMDMSDLDRLKTLLMQYRSGMEAGVVQSGHQLAMSLASRSFSKAVFISETWHGIHQLKFIKELTKDLNQEKLEKISQQLEAIGQRLFSKDSIQMALVGDDEAVANTAALSGDLYSQLEPVAKKDPVDSVDADIALPYEGWFTSTAVSFVAHTIKTVPMTHADGPALFVISKLLRSLYLHKEIREKGGAYGGFAVYNLEEGLFSLGSYRDPHIVPTLNVFDGILDFMASGTYNDENITEAILQACSEIDKPDAPGTAGQKAFFRQIVGLTDEKRIAFKQGVLGVTKDKVLKAAEAYFNSSANKRGVAVISGESQLADANTKLAPPLALHKI